MRLCPIPRISCSSATLNSSALQQPQNSKPPLIAEQAQMLCRSCATVNESIKNHDSLIDLCYTLPEDTKSE